jgi:hypothetical protein
MLGFSGLKFKVLVFGLGFSNLNFRILCLVLELRLALLGMNYRV